MSFTARVINLVLALVIFILAIAPVGSIFTAWATNWIIVVASALIIFNSVAHKKLYEGKKKRR